MDNSFVRRMAKGGDGGKKVGKKIVDGRFVSSGFIVMACARGSVPSPFFRPFLDATGKGTRFRKEEKYDVGFFYVAPYVFYFFFFSFLLRVVIIRETDARADKVGSTIDSK